MAKQSRLNCKSVLFSLEDKPLLTWCNRLRTGKVFRIPDEELQSMVIELSAENSASNYLALPKDPSRTMGITLPIVAFFIKNMNKNLIIEVQILDNTSVRRRFRICNFLNDTKPKPFLAKIPLNLDMGWNQVQLNLKDLTRMFFGTQYVETTHMQIHANCRLRRVFFANRHFELSELPRDYQFGTTKDIHLRRIMEKVARETREKAEKLAMQASRNVERKIFPPQIKPAPYSPRSKNLKSPLLPSKFTAIPTARVMTVLQSHEQAANRYNQSNLKLSSNVVRRPISSPKSTKLPAPRAASPKQTVSRPPSPKQPVSRVPSPEKSPQQTVSPPKSTKQTVSRPIQKSPKRSGSNSKILEQPTSKPNTLNQTKREEKAKLSTPQHNANQTLKGKLPTRATQLAQIRKEVVSQVPPPKHGMQSKTAQPKSPRPSVKVEKQGQGISNKRQSKGVILCRTFGDVYPVSTAMVKTNLAAVIKKR